MNISFISHVIYEASVVMTPVAGLIALVKGDKPERWGAGAYTFIVLVNGYCAVLCQGLGLDRVHAELYAELGFTLASSGFFLYLAVRYGSLWLAAAMVVEGMDFYFAQTYQDADQPSRHLYAIEVNLVTFSVFSILAAAAIWSWRARIRKRKAEVQREEAAQRRQEAWAKQYETLLAGRMAQSPAPAPVRGGRAHFTIEPTLS